VIYIYFEVLFDCLRFLKLKIDWFIMICVVMKVLVFCASDLMDL